MKSIILTFSALLTLILIDVIWIMSYARFAYAQQLRHLLRYTNNAMAPNWSAAFLVYLLMAIGLVFFVLPKADHYLSALLWGALFGFILYGVYDFTNFAILTGWPLLLSIVDVLWGAFLLGIVSVCIFWLQRYINA